MSNRTSFRPRLAAIAGVAAGLAAFALPVAAQAAPPEGRVKVMSRNVYLGANLTPALVEEPGPPDGLEELALDTQEIWNDVESTDFPRRAKLLAKEIDGARPDLVGLQEVALWRGDFNNPDGPDSGTAGDPDGPATPATTVKYDFLALLMKNLKKQGAKYRVVRQQKEADVEAPLAVPGGEIPADGRLTMRDVVLARQKAGVTTTFDYSQRFDKEDSLVVESIGGVEGFDVTFWRGFIAMDALVRGTEFRFVNTHLESFDNVPKLAQAKALVQTLPEEPGPATPQSAGLPVVLVGDLNSDDEIIETSSGVPEDEEPYAWLESHGLEERSFDGLNTDGVDAQYSCCFDAELINEAPATALDDIDHTVDHVMVYDDDHGADVDPNSNDIALANSFATGNDPAEYARFGRWGSDHLGVVSSLQFPTVP